MAPGPLRDRITAELRLGRSPEAIRADMVAEDLAQPPATETIYQALYAGALDVKPAECLLSRRRRRRCGQRRNPRSAPCGANIAAHYDLDVWFCDPYSPWQRGQIENLNRQVRWWFPRGADLRLVTPAQAQHAADIINHQRRRSLNHHSPAELYAALTVQ